VLVLYLVVVGVMNSPVVFYPPSCVDSARRLSGRQLVLGVCPVSAICSDSGKEGEAWPCSSSRFGKEPRGELESVEAVQLRCSLRELASAALVGGGES